MVTDQLTDGLLSTTLLQDASLGITLESIEVLADAGKVADVARGVVLDGRLEAGLSALGDIGEALGAREGGKSNGGESVLHLD